MIATGIFAHPSASSVGGGLVYGEFTLLGVQLLGALVIPAWTMVCSFLCFYLLDIVWGIRTDQQSELFGLDATLRG
jgi:Amt family ammonium transporter